MKKANYFFLALGLILLAIMVFISRNYDVNILVTNIFIVPVVFLIAKGFNKGKSTLSFEVKILIAITLGVVLVSLLTKDASATIILHKVISNVFSALVVLFLLYLKKIMPK